MMREIPMWGDGSAGKVCGLYTPEYLGLDYQHHVKLVMVKLIMGKLTVL